MFKKMLLSVVLLAVVVTGANAQAYRWTDSKGKTHFSDAPPPRGAKNARFFDADEMEALDATQKPQMAPYYDLDDMSGANKYHKKRIKQMQRKRGRRASKNFQYLNVMLYTSPACKQECEAVRELLTERGIKFNEKSIKDDVDEEWLARLIGENIVPSVSVGASVQKGFDPDALNALLDKAKFPKAVPMPEMKDPYELDAQKKTLPEAEINDSEVERIRE